MILIYDDCIRIDGNKGVLSPYSETMFNIENIGQATLPAIISNFEERELIDYENGEWMTFGIRRGHENNS